MSLPEITLDELARLVRLLGMLGSDSDGEVLAAGRFAARWVREHGTDWQTLLTPEPEPGVLSVAAVPDPEALEAAQTRDRLEAYESGYQDGMKTGLAKAMAQVKAQASMAASMAQAPHPYAHTWVGPGSPLGGFGAPAGAAQGAAAQGPVRAPGASPGAVPAGGWPPGSWQAVAQELLDQHAAVPGVLRSREEIFVSDILRRGFSSLTPAQEHWLRDIAGRAGMSW